MTQFTANEVRDLAKRGTDAMQQFIDGRHTLHIPPQYDDADMVIAECLRAMGAFADLLEAREKAVPVAYAEFADNGCVRMWSRGYEERSPGTRMVPLYTHPAPSDAERLAEALRELADKWEQRDYNASRARNAAGHDHAMELRQALAAHSAQAQPPAASVSEVTGLTWEAPDVTINVEQVGRFRSGDEHIVRVTFRSSDDGRRMTCFYSANESAVGYLHAMIAARENPNG